MRAAIPILLALSFAANDARGQVPDDEWTLEDGYSTRLLYLHALVNYAWDAEWEFDWQRRQFADSALRINTGSVSSDQLLTDIDLNLNVALGERWRFYGRFDREGFRRRPVRDETLLLGLEWLPFESSGFYLAANPEFNKAFIDVAAGYTFYRAGREQYVRVGVLARDINWDTKNQQGGSQAQGPLAVEWSVRWPLPGRWWLYSEGSAGRGYERRYDDPALSPELASQARNQNEGRVWLTREVDDRLWSLSVDVYDFEETSTYRAPGFDYDYRNRQASVGVEHIRVIDDRHRLRLLAEYVEQSADSVGFRAHDYSRTDLLGGVFYERLYRQSAWGVAYAFGQPDFEYLALDDADSYAQRDYTDKLIVGWRHEFSADAQIRITLSHEVSEKGFGGGAVQYQMFF